MHVATRSQTVNEVPRRFHLDLWSIVRSPIVLMLFSLITFHLGVSLTKGALELVSAPALSSLRQAFGAAILFAVFRPEVRGMNGRQWRVVLGMGASTALMTVLYFLALDRVSPGVATAIMFSGPCLMALGATRSRGQALGVSVSIGGVVLLAPWGGVGMDLTGYAFATLAGLSYAAFIVIANRSGPLLPKDAALPLSVGCSAVLLAPVGLATGGSSVNGSLLATIALTSVLSTVIPNVLEFSILRRITASLHGVLVSLNPAVGSIAGAVMLSNSIGPIGVLAIASICAGVALTHWLARVPVTLSSQKCLTRACA